MKNSLNILAIFTLCLIMSCMENTGSQGQDFTSQVNKVEHVIENDSAQLGFFNKERKPIEAAFQPFPTGSNRPKGWLLEMMQEDLTKGVVGALGELYPGIQKDDLYFTARRGGMEDIPEMGDLELTGEAWETSIMWWNAETIGNWWDGFVRHAFLTENEKAMQQSEAIVANLLASQDEDGYIGIYKANLRYQHEGSNGELWAQTTAFRMLLAYHELTQDKKVLEAVERAMAVTMQNYNEGARNPFDLKNAFGGVTHGLMMTDVCESLFRITDKQVYQDYAVYLYKAFSTYNINRAFNDLRYPFLMKKEEAFTGHGVHTYEHFRSLLNAWHQTGYPELSQAFGHALLKLDDCILPSGAGHGMEWIAGLQADATETGTEFCTMLELRNFLGTAALKTGEISYADHAEKLTFNGILGFRNQEGTAITYGKTDNCYKLDGKSLDGEEAETRYKYSPTHSEPAVCCVPNYTRNFTYFLDQMWGEKADGLAAIMYGPSVLTTVYKGAQVTIEQLTNYPWDDHIHLQISVDQAVEFTLYLRKPEWIPKMKIEGGDAVLVNGFYQINKTWEADEVIQIQFKHEVQAKEFQENEIYFQRGPLVYALEIPHRRENIKDYSLAGFHDYHCLAESEDYKNIQLDKEALDFEFIEGEKLHLRGQLTDMVSGQPGEVQLVPMGRTVLRRVTFRVGG